MDGHPRQNPAYRPATEKPRSGGASPCKRAFSGPSIDISMTVQPGDHMHVSVAATVPNSNFWVITLQDATRNETFSQTVPYSSSHLTAEWIEETRTPSASDPDAD